MISTDVAVVFCGGDNGDILAGGRQCMDNELRTDNQVDPEQAAKPPKTNTSLPDFLQGERLGARKGIGLEARVGNIAIQRIHIHHIQQLTNKLRPNK